MYTYGEDSIQSVEILSFTEFEWIDAHILFREKPENRIMAERNDHPNRDLLNNLLDLSRHESEVRPRYKYMSLGTVRTLVPKEGAEWRVLRDQDLPKGLFRTFARLQDETSILAFANRFGMDGMHLEVVPSACISALSARDGGLSPTSDNCRITHGSTIEEILHLTSRLNFILKQWDLLRNWSGSRAIAESARDLIFPDYETIPRRLPDLSDGTAWRRVAEECFVDDLDTLIGEFQFRLTVIPNGRGGVKVQHCFDTLTSLMCHRLVNYITGGSQFRPCAAPDCDIWFEFGGSGQTSRRRDARFCSDTCKARAHRLMKQQQAKGEKKNSHGKASRPG